MNGLEFAVNIKAIKPDTKIVLMSAFEVTGLEFSRFLVEARDFLRKPVDIKTLMQKVSVAITN